MMKGILIVVLGCVLTAGAVSVPQAVPQGKAMVDRSWKGTMGLSDEQETKFKLARRVLRDALTPLKDKLEDEVDNLGGLVNTAAPEKDITAGVERVREARRALMAEHEKFLDKVAAILTPIQRARAVMAMYQRGPEKGFDQRGQRGGRGHRGAWSQAQGEDGASDYNMDDEPDSDD